MKVLSLVLFWAIKITTALLGFVAKLCDTTVRFDNEKFAVFSYRQDDYMNACRGLLVHVALRMWFRNATVLFLLEESYLRSELDELLGEIIYRIKFYYSIRPLLDDIRKLERFVFGPIFIFTDNKRKADRLYQLAAAGLSSDVRIRYFRQIGMPSEFPCGVFSVWHLFLEEYEHHAFEKNLWWMKQVLGRR